MRAHTRAQPLSIFCHKKWFIPHSTNPMSTQYRSECLRTTIPTEIFIYPEAIHKIKRNEIRGILYSTLIISSDINDTITTTEKLYQPHAHNGNTMKIDNDDKDLRMVLWSSSIFKTLLFSFFTFAMQGLLKGIPSDVWFLENLPILTIRLKALFESAGESLNCFLINFENMEKNRHSNEIYKVKIRYVCKVGYSWYKVTAITRWGFFCFIA